MSKDDQWRVTREQRLAGEQHDGGDAPAGVSGDPDDSLDAALADLDALVGLESVKAEIRSLVDVHVMNRARTEADQPAVPVGLHIVFTGNPGTGKTSVARIVARIYGQLGLVSKGHLVEVDRSGLVAEYVGQTAPKVREVVDAATGGVLFIDEAYALAPLDAARDYGAEAIATLVKLMEDRRGDLAVVVAGYEADMRRFVDSNTGLRSRFQRFVSFPDYGPEELLAIFVGQANAFHIAVDDDVSDRLREIFAAAPEDLRKGNGRFARNLFEQMYARMANRANRDGVIEPHEIGGFAVDDVPDLVDGTATGATDRATPGYL